MAKKTLTTDTLPENAVKLFKLYVQDSGNWSGTPLVGGNVTLLGEKEDRGLLSYLKRAGLVTTREDHEPGSPKCYWLSFTDAGVAFAKSFGFGDLGFGEFVTAAQAEEYARTGDVRAL